MPEGTYREVILLGAAARTGSGASPAVETVQSPAAAAVQLRVDAIDGGASVAVTVESSIDGGQSWFTASNGSQKSLSAVGAAEWSIGYRAENMVGRMIRVSYAVTGGNATFAVVGGIVDTPPDDLYREFALLPATVVTASGAGPACDVGGLLATTRFDAIVTAVSGSSPTLNVRAEHSCDGGATWTTWAGASTGSVNSTGVKPITESDTTPLGRLVRAAWTVGGATPSFTLRVVGAVNMI